MALLQTIDAYWTKRAPGYAAVNQQELASLQKEHWQQELLVQIHSHFGKHQPATVRILDVGTGPGFFAIILAAAGFSVTAVDYTEAMLLEAKENAGPLLSRINFLRMDAQKLLFADQSFDVVVSRNLTWVLEQPDQAYAEWLRVLRPGGLLLNFDANWYSYLFDKQQRQAYEQDRANVSVQQLADHYTCTDIPAMEAIARQVPLSARSRPEWDERVLAALGCRQVVTDTLAWTRLWSEEEKVNYASTPMFMVKAVAAGASGGTPGERIK